MAEKKEEKSKPKLTAAEYWEWRTTIADRDNAKLNYTNKTLQLQVLEMKSALHRASNVVHAQNKLASAEAEYQRYKKVLEDRLGLSLDGKIIDDMNDFEVRDLPQEETKPQTQGGE